MIRTIFDKFGRGVTYLPYPPTSVLTLCSTLCILYRRFAPMLAYRFIPRINDFTILQHLFFSFIFFLNLQVLHVYGTQSSPGNYLWEKIAPLTTLWGKFWLLFSTASLGVSPSQPNGKLWLKYLAIVQYHPENAIHYIPATSVTLLSTDNLRGCLCCASILQIPIHTVSFPQWCSAAPR